MTGAAGRAAADDQWRAGEVDVAAYAARVGHTERLAADAATLAALHRSHVRAIPFENLDVPLGRGVSTDLADVQTKLVERGRGGYCFEHNLLFGAVLERVGFAVERLAGRVRTTGGGTRPRTHMMLAVRDGEQTWLADVGFGCTGLLEPLPLRDGATSRQGGWMYALAREGGGEWVLRCRAGSWVDLYAFTLVPELPVDFVVANHYIATHPTSPFVGSVIAQRVDGERRHALHDRLLVSARAGAEADTRTLSDDSLGEVLRDTFGLALSDAETDALAAALPDVDNARPAPRGAIAMLLADRPVARAR